MAYFAQLDGMTVTGILEAAEAPTVLPPGRTFMALEAPVPHFSTYDAQTKTFTPPVVVATADPVTNADLLAEIQKLTKP
jgi:hypothetical protein